MKEHIDPICGMEGHISAHGEYFCSHHCIQKYERQNEMQVFDPSCHYEPDKSWYTNKLLRTVVGT